MLKSQPDCALPRRSPGAHWAWSANCPDAGTLPEVDDPTPELIHRVRDALRAWASTDPAAR
ncbi:hypothetical protein [Nocardia macrotermitis]|uniref:Uncharacterized protein n=1 Tax=Nocardia macrotermitis TaxID=2585198 RepID=A0A7K0CVC5_9NOCA|nr:hypothetical protein [Nocardia macrotermitis]MQY17459.1 hypothetical protein [Nocardia macrotermitis]